MHAWHNSMTEQDPIVLPINFEEVGRKWSSGTFKSGDYNTEQMDSFTDALRLLYHETGHGDSEERMPPSARAMVKEMAPEWLERCGANICLITSSGRLERHTAVESPMLTHAFGMIYWKVLKAEDAVAKCAIFTDLGIELKLTMRATAYTVPTRPQWPMARSRSTQACQPLTLGSPATRVARLPSQSQSTLWHSSGCPSRPFTAPLQRGVAWWAQIEVKTHCTRVHSITPFHTAHTFLWSFSAARGRTARTQPARSLLARVCSTRPRRPSETWGFRGASPNIALVWTLVLSHCIKAGCMRWAGCIRVNRATVR
jgi:hypothetical protein